MNILQIWKDAANEIINYVNVSESCESIWKFSYVA